MGFDTRLSTISNWFVIVGRVLDMEITKKPFM